MCILGGIALFIAGGINVVKHGSVGFPPLIGAGIGVFFSGMIVIAVGRCVIQSIFSNRLQQAIATESAKYSSRSSKSCSWQLRASRYRTGSRNRHVTVFYHVSNSVLKESILKDLAISVD